MKKKIIFPIIIVCLLATAFIITQRSDNQKVVAKGSFFALDTQCSLEIRGMDENDANKLLKGAQELIAAEEQLLSKTVKASDIYKINHSRGKAVKVSKKTLKIIKQAQKISKDSDGLFDITLGQITSLWNFSGENPKVPETDKIKNLLSSVGYNNIVIKGQTVALKNPDTWLDLGAIAKGYIADSVTTYFKKNGVKSAIINLGGNVVALGKKPDGNLWNIGIEAPYSEGSKFVDAVKMSNQTMVTSGVYERYFEEKGIKYHHILDPKTGFPVKTDILSISVLGPAGKSGICDSLSTACLLLGKDEALKFMKNYKDFSILIVDTNNKIIKSDNWPDR